ncbi:hypothetical protein Tco_0928297 [Tanacetum coccineum]
MGSDVPYCQGLKCSTSNCGSKPTSNKKNDRISRTPSRNMKNKVEAQPRKVNKKNSVVEPICDVDVKHSLLNANSEPICATCKKSMFDGVHDMCLLDFVENMNSRAKSAKKHKKQYIWKPTSHVFTKVEFKWKPTGRTFTIVGNLCPLTRITSANVVAWRGRKWFKFEIRKRFFERCFDVLMVIFSNGGSLVSDSESEFSSAVIAMNSSNSAKISFSRRVPLIEWRILLPPFRRALVTTNCEISIIDLPLLVNTAFTCSLRDCSSWSADHHSKSTSLTISLHELASSHGHSIGITAAFIDENCDHDSFGAFPSYEAKRRLEIHSRVERKLGFLRVVGQKEMGEESANESGSEFIPCIVPSLSSSNHVFASPGFRIVICREQESGAKHGQQPTFDRVIIHWIVILKNIKKVTEVVDVKNWRVDNSRGLWWIISLIVWNSSVSSTKSSIQSKKTSSFLIIRSFSSKEKAFLGVLVKGGKARLGAKCGALRKKCGELWELMR